MSDGFEDLVRNPRFLVLSIPWILGIHLFWLPSTIGQPEDVTSIIQHSAEANNRDWAAAADFDNSERDHNKSGDNTYAVTMLGGCPYERLVAVNGRELSPSRQQAEEEKYNQAEFERQHESPGQKTERIAKYQAERKRDHILVEQMTTASNFRLLGTQVLNGYNVYVIKATPRAGYKPPDRDSQVLKGMEGTLWIDQKTFQWVKVEAHVTHPVRIEGFLAEVEPGTKFEFEKRPVADGIWLASHFSMNSNARILLLFPRRGQEDDSYFSYRKTANTSSGQQK
jgi:hypothetical protein